jgi:hypothetical protein
MSQTAWSGMLSSISLRSTAFFQAVKIAFIVSRLVCINQFLND